MTPEISDVLIIGGSHAGLAAALTLYRALHTCVIIDSQTPRNKFATPVRLTPTWDGEEPDNLRAASRKELQAAGGTIFVNAAVEKIGATSDGFFEAVDSNGKKWTGRKVLLAIGSRDILPNITGYESLYTRSMLVYHSKHIFYPRYLNWRLNSYSHIFIFSNSQSYCKYAS